jgi:multiple sugar transport system permease protein
VSRVAIRWALVALTATVALFPFLWMLRTAVAPADEVFADGLDLLPSGLTLGNFSEAWRDAGLGSAMLNGAAVVAAIVALQILTCVPAAYAFAKLRFRGRDLLYGLALIALLIPIQAVAIPTFLALSELDLVNTRLSLILPFATSAFGIFLIRQYMVTIPDALLEAARMDGLGHVRTLVRIVAPISRPAILTFALFSVFVHWNDYLWPLLVARDPGLRTPPLALAFFQQEAVASGVDFGALTAGAAIVTAPIVVLFVLTRRRFVAGISGGEVVG